MARTAQVTGSYSCRESFKQLHYTQILCKLDLVFFSAPVKCPNPGSPDFGHREGSNFLMGGEVVFSCMNAYELVGSTRLRCLDTGSWDNPMPYCRGEQSHVIVMWSYFFFSNTNVDQGCSIHPFYLLN